MNAYYILSTVPCVGNVAVNKVKTLCPQGAYLLLKVTNNK